MINLKCFTINTLTIVGMIGSFSAVAEKSHQQKYEEAMGKQMSVKCHVEYRGGGDDIRFVVGAFKKASQAATMLYASKIPKGEASKTILKVKECVKTGKLFKSSRAKNLDKQKPR